MAEPIIETKLARIQTDPPTGAATAFFTEKTTINGETFVSPSWKSVNWPLTSQETVTLDGLTLSYAEVSAFVVAIADRELAKQQSLDAGQ